MRLSSVEPKTSRAGADFISARRKSAIKEASALHAHGSDRRPERPGEHVIRGLLLAPDRALTNPDFI